MTRYVAFLRAINVTGRFIKMRDLREIFESFGLSNVATFIQSGNIIFDSDVTDACALEAMLQQRLEISLGYPVATFLRSSDEVVALAKMAPFPESEFNSGASLYIAFLQAPLSPQQLEIMEALRNPVDDFFTECKELFWLRRKQVGESVYSGSLFEKRLGLKTTIRNETTIRRIAARFQ